MFRLIFLSTVLACGLLGARSEQKQALDTWVHADTGSYGAAISPDDNRTLATGRAAKAIDIWDVASGKRRETWKPSVKHRVQPDSATILDLKLDTNARTLISELSAGIGQRWAIH